MNTGEGCHFLLQGTFPTHRPNPGLLCLLHWWVGSLPLSHWGSSQRLKKKWEQNQPNKNLHFHRFVYRIVHSGIFFSYVLKISLIKKKKHVTRIYKVQPSSHYHWRFRASEQYKHPRNKLLLRFCYISSPVLGTGVKKKNQNMIHFLKVLSNQ